MKPEGQVLMRWRTQSILEINHRLLADLDQSLLRPVEVDDYKQYRCNRRSQDRG